MVDGRKLRTLSARNPSDLPWKELGVELVFECAGALTRREDLEKHVRAGARFVLLSAPSKSEEVETVIHGVNAPGGAPAIISCASCRPCMHIPLPSRSSMDRVSASAAVGPRPRTSCRPRRAQRTRPRVRCRSTRVCSTASRSGRQFLSDLSRTSRSSLCSFSDQMPQFFISFAEVDQLGV